MDDYESGVLGKTIKYAYDGDDILYEFDQMNNLIARHTHGPGVDDPLYTTAQAQDGTVENYYYHKDGINSVREITNEDGEVVHRTDFDTFGNILSINDCDYDSSTMSSSNVSIGDPFSTLSHDFFFTYSYTGRQWDEEIDMYFYRARYYDAEIGRFISEDPQWNKNFYAYVKNNPIMYVDPSGEFFWWWYTLFAFAAFKMNYPDSNMNFIEYDRRVMVKTFSNMYWNLRDQYPGPTIPNDILKRLNLIESWYHEMNNMHKHSIIRSLSRAVRSVVPAPQPPRPENTLWYERDMERRNDIASNHSADSRNALGCAAETFGSPEIPEMVDTLCITSCGFTIGTMGIDLYADAVCFGCVTMYTTSISKCLCNR